jgi:hypothetical protein
MQASLLELFGMRQLVNAMSREVALSAERTYRKNRADVNLLVALERDVVFVPRHIVTLAHMPSVTEELQLQSVVTRGNVTIVTLPLVLHGIGSPSRAISTVDKSRSRVASSVGLVIVCLRGRELVLASLVGELLFILRRTNGGDTS